MPTHMSAAEAPEDLWRCHECGWTYPNHHPSAKHRRNHKKQCGTLPGFTIAKKPGTQLSYVGTGSSDDASGDDDHHQSSCTALHHGGLHALSSSAIAAREEQASIQDSTKPSAHDGRLSRNSSWGEQFNVAPRIGEVTSSTRSFDRSFDEPLPKRVLATSSNCRDRQPVTERERPIKEAGTGKIGSMTPTASIENAPQAMQTLSNMQLGHVDEVPNYNLGSKKEVGHVVNLAQPPRLEQVAAESNGIHHEHNHQGRSLRSAHSVEGRWICRHCGWTYPNAHPSAKHRRKHKKKCVVAATVAAVGGSSDDASSDEEHNRQNAVLDNGFRTSGTTTDSAVARKKEDSSWATSPPEGATSCQEEIAIERELIRKDGQKQDRKPRACTKDKDADTEVHFTVLQLSSVGSLGVAVGRDTTEFHDDMSAKAHANKSRAESADTLRDQYGEEHERGIGLSPVATELAPDQIATELAPDQVEMSGFPPKTDSNHADNEIQLLGQTNSTVLAAVTGGGAESVQAIHSSSSLEALAPAEWHFPSTKLMVEGSCVSTVVLGEASIHDVTAEQVPSRLDSSECQLPLVVEIRDQAIATQDPSAPQVLVTETNGCAFTAIQVASGYDSHVPLAAAVSSDGDSKIPRAEGSGAAECHSGQERVSKVRESQEFVVARTMHVDRGSGEQEKQDSSVSQLVSHIEGKALQVSRSVLISNIQVSPVAKTKTNSSESQMLIRGIEKADPRRTLPESLELNGPPQVADADERVLQTVASKSQIAVPNEQKLLITNSTDLNDDVNRETYKVADEKEMRDLRSGEFQVPESVARTPDTVPFDDRPLIKKRQPESGGQARVREESRSPPGSPEGLVRIRVEEFEKLAGVDPLHRRTSPSPSKPSSPWSPGTQHLPHHGSTKKKNSDSYHGPIEKSSSDLLESPKVLQESISHLRHQESNDRRAIKTSDFQEISDVLQETISHLRHQESRERRVIETSVHVPPEVNDVMLHLRHRTNVVQSEGQVPLVHAVKATKVVDKKQVAEFRPCVPWIGRSS